MSPAPVMTRSEVVAETAAWLATQINPPSPIIPALCARFGLSPKEACEAAREAALRQARAT